MSIHQERPFIAWVIATLQAGGLTVGDAVAPATVPAKAGYVVVYSLAGGSTSGDLDEPRQDAAVALQVTSAGTTSADQARWLADRVRTLLDAAVPAALSDGRKVIWLEFPSGTYSIQRDEDADPPRYWIPDRFEMGTA